MRANWSVRVGVVTADKDTILDANSSSFFLLSSLPKLLTNSPD